MLGPVLGTSYILPVILMMIFKVDDIFSNQLMKKIDRLTLVLRPAGLWQSWGRDKDVSNPRPGVFHHWLHVGINCF